MRAHAYFFITKNMKRVFPQAKSKTKSTHVENKRRARFLFSRREGVRFRANVDATNAYTGFPDNTANKDDDDAAADKEVNSRDNSLPVDDDDDDDDASTSNFYSCILIGINWWHALEKLAPRIPKKFSRELRESLSKCDPSVLERQFGKKPSRDIFPKIEQELNIDLYILIGGKYAPSCISYRPYRASGPLHMRNVYKELDKHCSTVELDYDDSLGVTRPVVVLQSGRPYFHKLGNFHTIPHGRFLEKLNSPWISLWRAIVTQVWPKIVSNEKEIANKIEDLKLSLRLAKNEKFQISDGIFNKLRSIYGINVRLFVGKYVNDNLRDKTCYYSTLKSPQDKKIINILVANYEPDKFEEEFRKFSGLSYKRLSEEPWRNPVLAANREFARRRDIAQKLDDGEIARTLRWTSKKLYHRVTDQPMCPKLARVKPNRKLLDSSSDSDSDSPPPPPPRKLLSTSTVTTAMTTDSTRAQRLQKLREIHKKQNAKIRRKMASQFLDYQAEDDDDGGGDGGGGGDEDDGAMSESDLAFINDGDEYSGAGGGGFSDIESRAERVLRDFDEEILARQQIPTCAQEAQQEQDTYFHCRTNNDDNDDAASTTKSFEDEPIRNLGGLVPNVFDSDTLVRVLKPSEVKELSVCPTPGCLYTCQRDSRFKKHVKTCSATTTTWIRQSVQGSDIFDFKSELVDEGFLPSASYATNYYCTFDIECLMSRGPFANEQKEIEAGLSRDSASKFHNVTTIATLTTMTDEKMGFTRQDDNYESSLNMLHSFVNYLLMLKRKLREMVPESVKKGIEVYANRLDSKLSMDINDGVTLASFHKLALYRKKLKYLQSFMKLNVYSWFGESYDMQVIYPMLVESFHRLLGERDLKKVNVIKRGAGYMLLECLGLSFRDFKNYTAPMKLGDLAQSCGLSTDEFEKGAYCYEWYTSVTQLTRAYNFPAYICFKSSMHIQSGKCAREINDYIYNISRENKDDWRLFDPQVMLENPRFGRADLTQLEIFKMMSLINIIGLLQLDNLSDDPALQEFCADETCEMPGQVVEPIDLTIHYSNLLGKLFYYSPERKCLQCEPVDPLTQQFFTFSIKDYVDSWELWNQIDTFNRRRQIEKHGSIENAPKMTMLYLS